MHQATFTEHLWGCKWLSARFLRNTGHTLLQDSIHLETLSSNPFLIQRPLTKGLNLGGRALRQGDKACTFWAGQESQWEWAGAGAPPPGRPSPRPPPPQGPTPPYPGPSSSRPSTETALFSSFNMCAVSKFKRLRNASDSNLFPFKTDRETEYQWREVNSDMTQLTGGRTSTPASDLHCTWRRKAKRLFIFALYKCLQ